MVKHKSLSKEQVIGELIVRLGEARDLAAKDLGGSSDPIVKLSIGKQSFSTKKQKKTLNPKWNEDFKFQIRSASANEYVVVKCKDWDPLKNDFLGQVRIPLELVLQTATHDTCGVWDSPRPKLEWFKLMNQKDKKQTQGEISLGFLFFDTVAGCAGADVEQSVEALVTRGVSAGGSADSGGAVTEREHLEGDTNRTANSTESLDQESGAGATPRADEEQKSEVEAIDFAGKSVSNDPSESSRKPVVVEEASKEAVVVEEDSKPPVVDKESDKKGVNSSWGAEMNSLADGLTQAHAALNKESSVSDSRAGSSSSDGPIDLKESLVGASRSTEEAREAAQGVIEGAAEGATEGATCGATGSKGLAQGPGDTKLNPHLAQLDESFSELDRLSEEDTELSEIDLISLEKSSHEKNQNMCEGAKPAALTDSERGELAEAGGVTVVAGGVCGEEKENEVGEMPSDGNMPEVPPPREECEQVELEGPLPVSTSVENEASPIVAHAKAQAEKESEHLASPSLSTPSPRPATLGSAVLMSLSSGNTASESTTLRQRSLARTSSLPVSSDSKLDRPLQRPLSASHAEEEDFEPSLSRIVQVSVGALAFVCVCAFWLMRVKSE